MIDLDSHIAFRNYQIVEKKCRVLFNKTPIQYFCYQRLYSDGSYTFLPSHIDLGNYFYKDGVYIDTWLFNVSFSDLKSGIFFWDIAKLFSNPRQCDINHTIKQQLKLGYGVEIVEKSHNYCDFYTFASNTPEIYFFSIRILRQFIYYFRQECMRLLSHSIEEKIIFDKRNVQDKIILPISNIDIHLSDIEEYEFDLNKIYLYGEYKNTSLTKKEIFYLKYLLRGFSAKRIALNLGISFRTVQNNIERIKFKLGCSTIIEAVAIAIKNHLF